MFLKTMRRAAQAGLAPVLGTCLVLAAPVPLAASDLLVAPTRVLLNGSRGTQVILNNIGTEEATYRISLELRRMNAAGDLIAVETPTAEEEAALAMIRYAPRRVVLPPNQPQVIRIGSRVPQSAPDGEYRVHMLFRAIPRPRPISEAPQAPTDGLSIRLTPIYGVTIPIIVRQGNLTATAAISGARIAEEDGARGIRFELSRSGERSTYGEILITRPGFDTPLVRARGVAVYDEVDVRTVTLAINPDFQGPLEGPIRIQYREPNSSGGGVMAETELVLR